MADALDNRVSDEARKWVDSLETKWRLQVLSKKYRLNSKGEKVVLPTRIRRFVEGIPHALVDEAIKYLLSLAPYRGIIYNGVPIEGEYRPTLTQWSRDNGDRINSAGQGANDGTYTLTQDLLERDMWDTYGVGSELSCSSETLTEYVWDAPSVEELPATGDLQGVTYAIAGVQRSEDGTFSYSIVKRVAKTQHMSKRVVKTDTMQTVEVEGWKSVYGSLEDGWRDDAGTPLDIPGASQTQGVTVEVQYAQQPDCTYDISVSTTIAKPVKQARQTKKTLFSHDHSDSYHGQPDPLPDAPKATGGKVEDHASQLQPDGTYRTTCAVTKEQDVKKQSVTARHGRWGYVHSVTDYGQPSAPNVDSLPVGAAVEYQRTPGDLYNVTRTSYKYSDQVGDTSCSKTIYQHTHSETRSAKSLFTEHVADASGGVIHSVNSSVDDSGVCTRTTRTDTELPVADAVVTVSATPFGRVTTKESRNQLSAADADNLSIGETVRVEKTPGGLFNNTVTAFAPNRMVHAEDCQKNLLEHSHTVKKTVSEFPSGDVPDARGGVRPARSAVLQSDGSIVQTDATTKELHVPVYAQTVARRLHSVSTTTEYRNAPSPSVVSLDTPGNQYAYSRTGGGLYSGSVTESAPAPQSDDVDCSKTVYQHQHAVTAYRRTPAADELEAPEAGEGVIYSTSVRADQEGLFACRTMATTEIESPQKKSFYETRFQLQEVDETANTAVEPAPAGFTEGSLVSVGGHRTPGGRWSRDVVTVTPKEAEWDYEVSTNWEYRYTVKYRNKPAGHIDELVKLCVDKLSRWCTDDVTAARMPSGYNIAPDDNLNDFGLHDGSVTLSVNWAYESAGQSGKLDATTAQFEWDVYSISSSVDHEARVGKNGLVSRFAHITRVIDASNHRQYHGRGANWLNVLFSTVKNNAKPYGIKHMGISYSVVTKVFALNVVTMGQRKLDKMTFDETAFYKGSSSGSTATKPPDQGGASL